MAERPVMFTAPMVRAILAGQKTETRRAVKIENGDALPQRFGQPGDQLWVKEDLIRFDRDPPTIQYAATISGMPANEHVPSHPNGAALWQWGEKKKISMMFMPRWASRITLNLLSVHMEPLHAITEQGARNEGIAHKCGVEQYKMLWNAINAKRGYPWVDNPLVWVVQFERA